MSAYLFRTALRFRKDTDAEHFRLCLLQCYTVRRDHRTDALVGKYLQQQAVCQTSVQDMYALYTALDRIDAVAQFRQHTAADDPAVDQCLCF